MQSYELHDGPRIVRFQGTHLARKTSDDGDRLRWLELDIYRTRAGKYIVHQVGKTVVYHLTDSDCTPKSFETVDLSKLDEGEPCPVCLPPSDDPEKLTKVRFESDLHRVMIHETAKGLVESLENVNSQGRRYHSRVVRDVLIEASTVDEDIREVFLVTEVA
jgi:EXLDI family protein